MQTGLDPTIVSEAERGDVAGRVAVRVTGQRRTLWRGAAWAGALVALALGVAARLWVWEATSAIRYVRDMENAYQWGVRVNTDAHPGAGEATWGEWFKGYRGLYERELAYPNAAVFELDYAPGRLLVMSLWARGVMEEHGAAGVRMRGRGWAWEDVGPLLWFNAACAAVAAVGAGFLVAYWVRRRGGERKAWGRGALAGVLVWLNPAVLANGHVWPQWDVWCLPFFIWGAYAASVGGWVWVGALLAAGAMFKAQLLLVAPAFVAWAWFSEGLRPVVDWVVGFAAAAGVGACIWLVPTGEAWAWVGWAMLTAGVAWGMRWRGEWEWAVMLGAAVGLAGPVILWTGLVTRLPVAAAVWGVACLPVLPVWWRLGRVPAVVYFAAVLAAAIWGAWWVFGGSLAWARIGFVGPTVMRMQMELGARNLPSVLADRWWWDVGDLVWGTVTIVTGLRVLYVVTALACGVAAAVHARRGNARVLVAIGGPWVLMYALLPQMHERYLMWGAAVSAVAIGAGKRFGVVYLVLTGITIVETLRPLLGKRPELAPGAWEVIRASNQWTGWMVIGVAGLYLWQAFGWPGWRFGNRGGWGVLHA